MYLARIITGSEVRYILRQSFFDQKQGCYLFRQVYDLGRRPADFIDRSNGALPVLDSQLEEAVALAGAGKRASEVLELLLRDFFTREEQEYLDRLFRRRSSAIQPFSQEEEERLAREVHLFDRKRLYYLRYGAVDQSRIHRLHKKLCRPLLGQCRDEREYSFMAHEKVLSPSEYRTYVFAIFNLQRFFGESFAPFMPEALDQTQMADRLIEEICRLNEDNSFWAGIPINSSLHPHLRRYLVMFFDYEFAGRSFTADFARQFTENHRIFRWPKKTGGDADVSEVFGKTMADLQQMTQKELRRLFRQRAKELHPDGGGDHSRFILLAEAYARLQKRFER